MVKVAVASSDGKVVNQHFGRADKFYILETDEDTGTYKLVEERDNTPICHNGDHLDNQLNQIVLSLSDCQYVIVSRIGIIARNQLESAGIEIFEIPDVISEAIDRLVKYIKVKKLIL